MSLNNYIVSGEGFLKSVTFDKDDREYKYEWTNLIREATPYKYKAASVVIKNHNLNAFIWNPFTEEPVRNKWRVVRRRDYRSFVHDENHEVLEWKPEKVVMESKSDVGFLRNRSAKPEELYDSLEEATVVANERNMVMMQELQKKMESMSA